MRHAGKGSQKMAVFGLEKVVLENTNKSFPQNMLMITKELSDFAMIF
jgi:hypothetical protein